MKTLIYCRVMDNLLQLVHFLTKILQVLMKAIQILLKPIYKMEKLSKAVRN